MTAQEFFEQYPNVDTALQVGGDFFFQEYAGSAREFAKRLNLEVVTVTRTDAESDGTATEVDGTDAEIAKNTSGKAKK